MPRKKAEEINPDSMRCSHCKLTKLLSEFYHRRGGKYGRDHECKACGKASSIKSKIRKVLRTRPHLFFRRLTDYRRVVQWYEEILAEEPEKNGR